MTHREAEYLVGRIAYLRERVRDKRAEEKRRIDVEFEGVDPGHFGWMLEEEEEVERIIEEINGSGTHLWVEWPLGRRGLMGAVSVADWVEAVEDLRSRWNSEVESLRETHGRSHRVSGDEMETISRKVGVSFGSLQDLIADLKRIKPDSAS